MNDDGIILANDSFAGGWRYDRGGAYCGTNRGEAIDAIALDI